MRIRHTIAAAALFAFAAPAWAQTAPVSFSPEFQTSLEEDYGVREGAYLSRAVTEAISAEFARRGLSGASDVRVTIVEAEPNRPTMQQMFDQPSLDARSISIGGAELQATLPGGQIVTHRRFNHSLEDVTGASWTWSEARRSIRQFAVKVADAVATPR